MDNFSGHKFGSYSNIKIHFFPPNTTSVLQPLDQGIIESFKSHYRSQLIREKIAAIERKKSVPEVDLYSAIMKSKRAWDAVSSTTISNCFRKAGFNGDSLLGEGNSI